MTVNRTSTLIRLAAVAAAIGILAGANGAQAAPPVKPILTSQFGSEVNLTEAGKGVAFEDVCTVASKDECRVGTGSSIPGGFQLTESVAGAPGGNVYVADASNSRIQEFNSEGVFVLMFGREVNETTKGDVCTAAEVAKSAVKCKAGVEGSAPGQFEHPYSVAVDPVSGDVYVAEVVSGPGTQGERVQKFTAEGGFVFEIGKEVNGTTKGNLCTGEEEVSKGVKCTGPALREFGVPYTPEPGSFNFELEFGDVLTVDHEGGLYVGDEGRVQEFKANGEFSGEIPVGPGDKVDGLAVDQVGDVYLTYSTPGTYSNIVEVFNAKGEQINSFVVSSEEPGAEVRIYSLALDAEGHLAITGQQQTSSSISAFGSLYEAGSARLLTEFKIPSGRNVRGIGFNGGGLYVATGGSQEILAYRLKPVAELVTGTVICVLGTKRETDVTFDCTLGGEVNPEGVSETEAWFQWGGTEALGEQTPKQNVQAAGPVPVVITVQPNAAFLYRLAAEDLNAKAPEQLTGEREAFATPLVAPNIVGSSSALFVKASSTVLFAELNPENANTEYFFEYAPGEEALLKCPGVRKASCPGVTSTPVVRSAVYGKIGAPAEATGLQPSTLYSYRLFAEDENAANNEKLTTTGPLGSFTTAPIPAPHAETGGYSSLTSTSAIVSATIDPDGAPVTYAFELGVYNGANTRYGEVSSGTVDPSGGSVEEALALTGLQPNTTYAYRIAISSGYISNETHTLQGQPFTFTTYGFSTILLQSPAVLTQLPVPNIPFPKATHTTTKKSKKKAKKKQKKSRTKQSRKTPRRA